MTSNSSSLFASRSHIASAVRAGLVNNLWSKQVFSQDKFDDLGIVAMFPSGVFGSLPNCASNGVISVVAFGATLRVLMISASSEANL